MKPTSTESFTIDVLKSHLLTAQYLDIVLSSDNTRNFKLQSRKEYAELLEEIANIYLDIAEQLSSDALNKEMQTEIVLRSEEHAQPSR